MAKNDWRNANSGTRTTMNQPYWLVSGTYNSGATRFELQVGPGSIRFPYTNQLVYSSGAQQLLINNPAGNTYYTTFVRSDGTFIVSGTTSATVPGPPRYDAEPIGTVWNAGASLATANMVGPWNQGGGAQQIFEQRGQYVASTTNRVIWDYQRGVMGTMLINSGIMYLNFRDFRQRGSTLIRGYVDWVPSGVAANGQVQFKIVRAIDGGTVEFIDDCAGYLLTNNPFNGGSDFGTHHTSFEAMDTIGSGTGYRLVVTYPQTNAQIFATRMAAFPGWYDSVTSENP